MQIKEVMTREVECVRPDVTLHEAARKMRDLDVGPLPVCGINDRIIGIVTDRDIVVRSVADGQDPKTAKVRDVMTPSIIFCFDHQEVEDAARLMEENQIRRLAVLNGDKRLVGIVSLGDLAVHREIEPLAAEALEAISESR